MLDRKNSNGNSDDSDDSDDSDVEKDINVHSVISLTLGVLSIIIFPFIGWILGLAGLIYSRRSFKEIGETGEDGKNLAIAGRICSIVGILVSFLFLIVIIGGYVMYRRSI